MLPSPATRQRQRSKNEIILEMLRRQSRATNLAVFMLLAISSISVLVNVRYCFSLYGASSIATQYNSDYADLDRPFERNTLDHLIIVPCHSIWVGSFSWSNEEDWLLESYQRGSTARPNTFYQHIATGAELAKADELSLLVFSGGQTKPLSTTTEAESYLRLAQRSSLLPSTQPFRRATTENYALDSYQNLLFSLARFREYTGHFPAKITVVGYDFKKARFEDLHRTAIRWPKYRFHYIGLDPYHDQDASAVEGELRNGYLPYTLDRYGCHSILLDKRRQRNPHTRFHPYGTSVPELRPLFRWCPGRPEPGRGRQEILFPGDLPWDHITLRPDMP